VSLFLDGTFGGVMRNMSKNGSANSSRKSGAGTGQTLDLERYVPAFVTFIANKLSRSATAFYQKRFGVNVTEWRIMSLLAIEPGIPASRICHVIGFDKGPVSRTLALMQKRGLIAISTDPRDGRSHSISLTPKGRQIHDAVIVAALERERRLLACLRKDEREVLIDLLRRVHSNLDAVTEPGD
jgi:DNA-binding MarR family transcriptional regulator